MANYRDQIIESVRDVRRFSVQSLGHQNTKTAFETSARGIANITLHTPNDTKFYDRDVMDLSKVYITHNGKRYPLEIVSDSFMPETLSFFVNGMIDYHNYQILMDKARVFYDIRENALTENPTMNIVDLVGDALVAEGQNINSVKLDVAFLQKNSLGTLNTPVIGFENALFYAFGPFNENDPQIQNFINAVCEAVPEASRENIRQTVINCFNNATQRAAASENINEGVRILIEGFSGVSFENFHERAHEIYESERAKYPLITQYEEANASQLRSIAENDARVRELEALRDSQRTPEEIQRLIDEQNAIIEELEGKISQNVQGINALNTSRHNAVWITAATRKYENQNQTYQTEIDERRAIVTGLQTEMSIINGTYTDSMSRPIPLTHEPIEVTIGGETRRVVNPGAVNREIDVIEQNSADMRNQIMQRDAYLICAYSLIHYAIDFRHLGAEIVEALKTFENIGHLDSDLDFNSEEIRQALSIANNVVRLLDQDSLNSDQYITNIRAEVGEGLFAVYQRYVQVPGQNNPFNDQVLGGLINNLTTTELLPNGQPNPFFGRGPEISERMQIAVAEQTQIQRVNNIEPVQHLMRRLDPKLKTFNARKVMIDYLKKQKLIPVTKIKFSNRRYTLDEEYKPRETIDRVIKDPPPPGDPKKLNYCREMYKAIKRELEALNGTIATKDRDKDGQNAHFERHYCEILSQVQKSFNYYASNPEAFDKYQDSLMKKIQEGKPLTEKECLMIRFCPKFNPILREYAEMIDAANASKDPKRIEALRVGGNGLTGNSMFPHPLNEGFKAAITTINMLKPSEPSEDFTFDVRQITPEFIAKFAQSMTAVGEDFKTILEDPEVQKYRDFLTIKIKDNGLIITESTYTDRQGKSCVTNSYDQRDMDDKVIPTANPNSEHMRGTEVYILENDELRLIPIADFASSPNSDVPLKEVAPGKFAMETQLETIRGLAVEAAQNANAKTKNAKITVKFVSEVENTREAGTPTSGSGSDPT